MGFALFFLGEYANMLLMSSLTTILFFAGWLLILNITPFTFISGLVWWKNFVGLARHYLVIVMTN
jgi:NADH-quinone oxidoreductase subunit H